MTRSLPPAPLGLSGDCAQCAGLCCVALPFAASSDFAVGKAAGAACAHLREDFRCGIHARLRESGLRGCTVYDCFGAGQNLSRNGFADHDWRGRPERAAEMFAAFAQLRHIHELLVYLDEAITRCGTARSAQALRSIDDELRVLAVARPTAIVRADVPALRARVGPLLDHVSARVRRTVTSAPKELSGADLFAARRPGADLRGSDLRGAVLIAADLRGANLSYADLRGADLRDIDLRGTDLTGALFLTGPQVSAARGDAGTRLPDGRVRPAHWADTHEWRPRTAATRERRRNPSSGRRRPRGPRAPG
ncbi:pentapeptide repeat-containing protein [Rhodococcus triatomae]|uniref:Pentapeptide repeat-containing protein n=1 Tax=Rhodococcus triatomae TaxID=300028 RepID=A0A1G8P2Y7_9NOCA|nr:pentapeptide repeat-containing protein [Rhodococcus triatomae]QNG18761.1 pentapeptide repeat-containing protein [Rhodococcus triatomae]QNG25328.1 pentapeptide repeat-containing protein [Rhodococcus triatomae]SDI86849.1 Pentapeptide repeat-containing protein [Rhodococcus triatomae]